MQNLNKKYLESLYKKYNKRQFINPDPLQFLYQYKDIKDREIIALLSASFAYGNVKQIIKIVDIILKKIQTPHSFIMNTKLPEIKKLFKGFRYRFTDEHQLCNLLYAIGITIKEYGSLEKCFMSKYNHNDTNILPALTGFLNTLRSYGNMKTLISDPHQMSALKRSCLFLRWMIRKDMVDIGGWNNKLKSKLIIPLDTHMYNISKKFNLTKSKSANMKTAIEITNKFRQINKADPVKYDFCLTRFGIRDEMSISNM